MPALPVSYVLPLRWDRIDPAATAELTGYLRGLRELVDVTVVDGSPPVVFAHHHGAWRDLVRHEPPDPAYRFANGKVNGVMTGVLAARHDHVVIADDDVRHTEQTLTAMHRALYTASVVRPQNYFDPLPWHARWDTARSLLNRAFGADYPGTLGVRRTLFAAMGGYDGDVLFENLELIRTVRAAGGREAHRADVYVRRLPPETRRFWQQRVRQAYDEFAQPARMTAFLAVLPAAVLLPPRGRVAAAAAAVALAEVGRRRARGGTVFPRSAVLLAPVWLMERGTCAWLAVGQRFLFGGVSYAGGRLRNAGNQCGRKTARTQLSSFSLKMR
jgi:Glycosyl transferase family 21